MFEKEPEEPLIRHSENIRLKDVPKDILENISRLREEARSLNQGIETHRKGYEALLVKIEAFNIRIENLFKNLLG